MSDVFTDVYFAVVGQVALEFGMDVEEVRAIWKRQLTSLL